MKAVKVFLRGIMQVELAIGAVLAIYIIAIMVVEIVMRYVFNNSIIWVQESVMLAFIWVTALGASCALMTGSHISIDTLTRSLPAGAQRLLRVLISLTVLACLIFLATTLPTAIKIQNKSRTASLPINFPKGFYYSLPILVSVVGMIAGKLYYLVYEIGELFGRSAPAGYRIAVQAEASGDVASNPGGKVDVL